MEGLDEAAHLTEVGQQQAERELETSWKLLG